MSDPFEELEKHEEGEEEEAPKDPKQAYEELKKFILDEFKKYGVTKYDFTEPFTLVRIFIDNDKIELTYKGQDAFDYLFGHKEVYNMFSKFISLKLSVLDSDYRLAQLFKRKK